MYVDITTTTDREVTPMNATELAAALQSLLDEFGEEASLGACRTSTFEEAGLMTRDAGLLLRLEDGQEFQLTLLRSR
jgi:hypothetical protein